MHGQKNIKVRRVFVSVVFRAGKLLKYGALLTVQSIKLNVCKKA